MSDLIYRILCPSPELSDVFDQIELIEVPADYPPFKVRFLPDDRFYVLFRYGNPFTNNLCGIEWQYKKRFFLSGITPYYSISKINGFTGLIAFRFNHCGFRYLSDLKASVFYNRIVDADSLFSIKTDEIIAGWLNTENKYECIPKMEYFFMGFLKKPDSILLRIKEIVDSVVKSKGNESIHQLAQDHGMSYTYLEKLFKEYVGISPKMFCKLQAIRSLIKLNMEEPELTFTQLAHQTGYYDQSHFIKDFKRFTGLTPFEHHRSKKFFGDSFAVEDNSN